MQNREWSPGLLTPEIQISLPCSESISHPGTAQPQPPSHHHHHHHHQTLMSGPGPAVSCPSHFSGLRLPGVGAGCHHQTNALKMTHRTGGFGYGDEGRGKFRVGDMMLEGQAGMGRGPAKTGVFCTEGRAALKTLRETEWCCTTNSKLFLFVRNETALVAFRGSFQTPPNHMSKPVHILRF